MNILFNISNHASDKWSVAQKQDWDKIIDIPFPNIPAAWDTAEVIENAVTPIAGKLGEIEKVKEDGSVEKVVIFEFCRWRKLNK